MGQIQIGDIVRATAVMHLSGYNAVMNTYTFQHMSPGSAQDSEFMEDVADYLETIYAQLVDRQTNAYYYDEITGFNVTQDRPLTPVEWPTLVAGTFSGPAQLPNQLALLAVARTEVNRRMGKKYWGGFTASDLTNGEWAVVLVEHGVLALAAYAVDSFVGHSTIFRPGVWDRVHSEFSKFTTATVYANPAVQRRRRQGEGI